MPSVERIAIMRWAGIGLLITAFAFPGLEWNSGAIDIKFEDSGLSMFFLAPFYIHKLIFHPSSMGHMLLGLWSAAAWSCNFTALFRLGRAIAWIPLVTPWLWLCMYLLFANDLGVGLLGYWPMYPWLIGLTMLNAAVYLNTKSDEPTAYQPL